jgi:hypothetical protein
MYGIKNVDNLVEELNQIVDAKRNKNFNEVNFQADSLGYEV